jgi:hypothetical protein
MLNFLRWLALVLTVIGLVVYAHHLIQLRGDPPCYVPSDIGSHETAKTRPSCQ